MADALKITTNGSHASVADVTTYSWPGADTDAEARRVAAQGYQSGISSSGVRQHYDDISLDYDDYLCPGRYKGPRYAADAIVRHFGDQKDIRILDVAAGTGMVCEQLNSRGFENVDALDPSTKMMELAKKKHLYHNYFVEFLGQEGSSIGADAYDAITVAGGMGEGHIPCSAFVEMARIVKPGGLLVITLRKEYLVTCADYWLCWDQYLQQLEAKGVWEPVERREVPHYAFEKSGLVYVFRVKSRGSPHFTFEK